MFTIASGIQSFCIGFTFWGTRTILINQVGVSNWWNRSRGVPLRPRTDLTPSKDERMRASCISGAFTGASQSLVFRGPRFVIPGTIMFTLYGWLGQHAYNYLDQWNSDEIDREAENRRKQKEREGQNQGQEKEEDGWFRKWLTETRLLKKITPEEYQNMMTEKLIAVEADIAIIEEKIEELRQKQKELDEKAQTEKAQTMAKESTEQQKKN